LFRAKLLDELIGINLEVAPAEKVKTVNIPFDIDDIPVTREVLLGTDFDSTLEAAASDGESRSVADADNPGEQAYENVKRGSKANNPLDWQNVDPNVYRKKLRNYRKQFKKKYVQKIKELLAATQNAAKEPDKFRQAVMEVDLTPYTTIQSISRDLTFNNTCVLDISMTRLREVQTTNPPPRPRFQATRNTGLSIESIPRENDVVEITLQYPNESSASRVFVGLVSVISQQEQHGTITAISIECYGVSKMLLVNRMVTDRAVISQFEDGETAQVGLSPMTGGTFAEKTVDQIFTSLMLSQLALKADARGNELGKLKTERTTLLNSRSSLLARNKELTSSLTLSAQTETDKEVRRKRDRARSLITEDSRIGKSSILTIQDNLIDARPPFIDQSFLDKVSGESTLAKNTLLVRLADIQLERREELINDLLKKEQERDPSATNKDVNIDFKFDPEVFQDEDSLQMIYIPLITMMAVRSLRDNVSTADKSAAEKKALAESDKKKNIIAKFSGRQARAFDFLLRKGFELFFSQLSTPNTVLDEIRSAAKFVVYENEENQVVCEIPRYNIFGTSEEGERIEDFIIVNPEVVNTARQDVDLLTRVDMRGYAMLLGQLDLGTITWGQFTDIAVMSKYGMRAEAPIYNPNTSFEPKSRLYFAAIELAWRNSDTRTLSVNVIADRQYKLGRLYFLARESMDIVAGGPPSPKRSEPVEINGYVGYLSKIDTTITHGSPIMHNLTFRFIRKAQLGRVVTSEGETTFVANFKILPDLRTMMDVLDDEIRTAKSSTDPFERRKPKDIPTGSAKIGTVQFAGGVVKYYQGEIILKDNQQWLPLGFMSNDPEHKERKFITSSLGDTIHHVFPPFTKPPKLIDNVTNAVGVQDTSEGFTRLLATWLACVDMKLRTLNRVLFSAKNRGASASPSTRFSQDELELKNRIFQVKYIPSEKVNADYRIAGLGGLPLTVIDSTVVGNSFTTPSLSESDFDVTSNNRALLSEDFTIASGKSFRIETPRPNFVILRLLRRRGGTFAIPLTSAAEHLKGNVTRISIAGFVESTTKALYPPEYQILKSEALAIIDAIPSDGGEFLPVIFMGPMQSEQVIFNADPGSMLSLYDAGRLSTFEFPAVTAADPNHKSKNDIQHQQGKAVDITLFPWFASTGLTLKPHNPYILEKNYEVMDKAGGHLHEGLYTKNLLTRPILVDDFTERKGRQLQPTRRLLELIQKIDADKKASPDEKTKTREAFEQMLNKLGSLDGFTPTERFALEVFGWDDLHDNDQVFYHMGV
jgi:hypothetical protein